MLSITQVSCDAPEVTSTRQPWVEISISLAPVRLRPGSRIEALSRIAMRGTVARGTYRARKQRVTLSGALLRKLRASVSLPAAEGGDRAPMLESTSVNERRMTT